MSTSPINRYANAARWQTLSALEPIKLPSAAGGVPTLAPKCVICGTSAIAATVPTTATLASDFPSSKIARVPNRFLAPAAGLTRLMSGLSAVNDGLNPTCATLARTPTAMHIPAIGATVVSSVCRPASRQALEAWRPR